MAIWAAWILLDTVLGWQRWHGSGGTEWSHLIAYFSRVVVPLIGIAFVVVLAPAFAFGFSPWRSDAFWRTRPLSLRHILASRIAFFIVAFCLIPMAFRIAVMVLSGVGPELAFSNALGYSLGFLAAGAVLWGLAMHFSGWRQFLAAILGLGILVFFLYRGAIKVLIFFANLRLEGLPYEGAQVIRHPLEAHFPDGLIESRFLVAGILLIAAGSVTGGVLFCWRNRAAGLGVMVLSLAVTSFIPMKWLFNLFEAENLGTVRFSPPAWTEGPPIGGSMAEVELLWNENDVPRENWLGLLEISTKYPLENDPTSTWRLRTIDRPAGMGLSIQSAFEPLGIGHVPGIQRKRVPLDGRIRFPVISVWWERPVPWTVSGEVRAHWFRHEIAGSIPLKPGARFIRDGNLVVIDKVRIRQPSKDTRKFLTIELVADRLSTWLTANESWRTSPSSMSFEEWHLALVFPPRPVGDAEISLYRPLGRIPESRFSEQGVTIHIPIFDKNQPEVPPLITKENLTEARLTILRPVYRETMVAPFAGGRTGVE